MALQKGMAFKRKIINDPVYDGFLAIDEPLLLEVVEHPYFQRHRRIKQLGLTYLVYPGAMHTRFSHMLGAMNLMGRALEVLKAKGVSISDEEALGARLAILLHDVGHGPFSHTSERVLVDVHHERLTSLFMHRMNEQLGGRLQTAIAIFENSYPKRFLHQLVSSQLDMDRLDYLGRDSFFTGVSEGIVGTDRIISMLNVHDDELVIGEKGIYSVEKFIISRRLMYWQVYMHKTVIAADQLLLSILRRAREIIEKGGVEETQAGALATFLKHSYKEADFVMRPELVDLFAEIDDDDVMVAIKQWHKRSVDAVLRDLCGRLIERRLEAIKVRPEPFEDKEVETMRRKVGGEAGNYLVKAGQLHNSAYSFNDGEIRVLFKSGEVKPISEASDQLDRHFLEKQVTKHFMCYPKELN